MSLLFERVDVDGGAPGDPIARHHIHRMGFPFADKVAYRANELPAAVTDRFSGSPGGAKGTDGGALDGPCTFQL